MGVGAGVGVGVGAGVVVFPPKAVTMACNCAVEREESELMALTEPMAVCKRFMVAPALAEVASGPWQPAQ